MRTMTQVAGAFALAMVLGAAGCRGGNTNRDATQPAGDDTSIGARPQSGQSGDAQKQAQSGDQSGVYEVGSMEQDEIILRQRGTDGEMEKQSGSEMRVKKEDFQRLAGREAKQGDVVHVQTGSDGKPSAIHLQAAENTPGDSMGGGTMNNQTGTMDNQNQNQGSGSGAGSGSDSGSGGSSGDQGSTGK